MTTQVELNEFYSAFYEGKKVQVIDSLHFMEGMEIKNTTIQDIVKEGVFSVIMPLTDGSAAVLKYDFSHADLEDIDILPEIKTAIFRVTVEDSYLPVTYKQTALIIKLVHQCD